MLVAEAATPPEKAGLAEEEEIQRLGRLIPEGAAVGELAIPGMADPAS